MPKYAPITKTLASAKPTVNSTTNKVIRWDIEVEYSFAGNEAQSLPAWSKTYSHSEDVTELDKAVADFTKTELVGLMNLVIEEHVFEAHYEAFALPQEPAEVQTQDFDVNNLPD
jgi:hypothetical protein